MNGDAALYGESSGHGAPLVLLHGWGMNLRVFDGLCARLAARYAVTALDLPGHGRSSWPSGCSSADVLALIAAAVPPQATLIGWSLGGQLALELALAFAATQGARRAVRRLVLIATTPRFMQTDGWDHGLASATLQRFAGALEHDAEHTLDEFIDLQVRGSRSAAEVRAALCAALDAHGRAALPALRAGLTLLADTDQRERARQIAIPVLVIAGQHDRVVPLAATQALAALLPRSQLQVVQRAGHAPFLSHTEAVGAAVLDFLASTDDEVPRQCQVNR